MGLPGWGTLVGRIAEWLPGKREAKEDQIANLLRENAQLQRQVPDNNSLDRITRNFERIKRLREELQRID